MDVNHTRNTRGIRAEDLSIAFHGLGDIPYSFRSSSQHEVTMYTLHDTHPDQLPWRPFGSDVALCGLHFRAI